MPLTPRRPLYILRQPYLQLILRRQRSQKRSLLRPEATAQLPKNFPPSARTLCVLRLTLLRSLKPRSLKPRHPLRRSLLRRVLRRRNLWRNNLQHRHLVPSCLSRFLDCLAQRRCSLLLGQHNACA